MGDTTRPNRDDLRAFDDDVVDPSDSMRPSESPDTKRPPPKKPPSNGESSEVASQPLPTESPLNFRPTKQGDDQSSDDESSKDLSLDLVSGDDTVIRDRAPFSSLDQQAGRPTRPPKELVGKVLQHYTLDRLIGYGGMGVVFRASDIRLNRTVAVKVLTYRDGKNEEIIRRFQQEAQSAAQLAHENIAQVYDVGEADGWNFIAFEFVDGPNIRDMVLNDGPLTVDASIGFVVQTAEALNHANDRDIVHRDVKPSNLIVNSDGQVKLVDMGLARLRDVESDENDLTESGMTLGTFDYISPEQAQDPRAADIRSDLYSLGCSLYFMLVGRPPFPPGTAAQKLLQHANQLPPDPREDRNDVPESLVHVMFRMLAKEPSQRYQTPLDLITALQAVADNERIELYRSTVAAPVLVTSNPSWFVRHIPWLIPVFLLCTSILAFGGFPWTTQSIEIPPFQLSDAGQASLIEAASADEAQPEAPLSTIEQRPPESSVPTTQTERPEVASPNTVSATDAGKTNITYVPIPRDIPSSKLNGIRRIIVMDPTSTGRMISPPRDTILVYSLKEAFDFATLPNLRQIELRSPTLELSQRLQLQGKDLSIVAGEDYLPVIRWVEPRTEPEQLSDDTENESGSLATETEGALKRSDVTDRLDTRNAIFQLAGGSVRMRGIVLFLGTAVSRSQPISDAVFELREAANVELEDCWIRTEVEGGDEPLALFDIVAPDEHMPGMDQPSLRLTDCVMHGDLEVVRADIATPFDMDWSNGFVASSSRVFQIGGGIHRLAVDEIISLRLDHITAAVENGLIGFEASATASELIDIDVECTSCIFVGSPRQPLIEHIAFNLAVDRLEDVFHFRGRRNFYENTNVLWRQVVRDQDDSDNQPLRSLSFGDWRRYHKLEASSRWNAVQWNTRISEFALPHMLVPEDFALSTLPGNPARLSFGGAEKSSAGMDLDDLPQLPLLMPSP